MDGYMDGMVCHGIGGMDAVNNNVLLAIYPLTETYMYVSSYNLNPYNKTAIMLHNWGTIAQIKHSNGD